MADEELQQLWKESALAYSYLGSVTDVKTQWPTLTCRCKCVAFLCCKSPKVLRQSFVGVYVRVYAIIS